MPFTVAKMKSLKPKVKPYKVSDYDSLFVLVTPNGSKLWKFKFRVDGKEKSLSLGKYPAVTLKRARFLRDEARRLHAEGVDPAAKKQKAKAKKAVVSEHTFAKLAEKFLAKQLKEGKSEGTIKK
ncbi:Arm DNA-binding domain-containing protein [Litorimonas sp. WD9-15]|uniref:Arm DNA-binding domain-containing protein n=1 Tax=Litorimonas sp. WD9-15 TaxID=3418716 RepID=UPI003D09081C